MGLLFLFLIIIITIALHIFLNYKSEKIILEKGEAYCDNCNGSKYTICHCGDEICPKCKGKGKIDKSVCLG